jgi:hypothetical protein
MKVVFALHYAGNEKDFGQTDGGTTYGNRLLEHVVKLRRRLEEEGFTVLTRRECAVGEGDVAVFGDLDQNLWSLVQSLPANHPCVLIATESPIYTPASHRPEYLFARRWSRVLTWNRSYRGPHIRHYDIAVAGATAEDLRRLASHATPTTDKGVVITTLKRHQLGLSPAYNALCRQLAAEGRIDIYGAGWPVDPARGMYGPTDNKLEVLRRYAFSLLSENSLHAGYVTEKLPDSIVAGVPALYHGDHETAERRFPGTFVRLSALTREAFRTSHQEFVRRRDDLKQNIRRAADVSASWDEDFIRTLTRVLVEIRSGLGPS